MNWKPRVCSLLLLLPAGAVATDELAVANRLFDAGRYAEAVAAYETIEPRTAHVYFNLGNAHVRQDQLGRAVLNYERARRLAPRDPDILANLRFAAERLGVAELNQPPGRGVRLWQGLLASRTLREWGVAEVATLWFGLGAIGLTVWLGKWRGVLVTIAGVSLAGWVLTVMALSARLAAAPAAVVHQARIEARFAPQPEATVHYTLPAGARVTVREDRGHWWLVERADGKQGWIPAAAAERI